MLTRGSLLLLILIVRFVFKGYGSEKNKVAVSELEFQIPLIFPISIDEIFITGESSRNPGRFNRIKSPAISSIEKLTDKTRKKIDSVVKQDDSVPILLLEFSPFDEAAMKTIDSLNTETHCCEGKMDSCGLLI